MSDLYLGKIDWANGESARVEPLAFFDGGNWAPLDDATRHFPDNGYAFAPPSANLGRAKSGSYYAFSIGENNSTRAERKDHFIVHDPSPAVPIIDLTYVSLEAARQTLFDVGVDVPHQAVKKAIVLLAGGVFCAINMEDSSLLRKRALPQHQLVQLVAAPSTWINAVLVDGWNFTPESRIPVHPVVKRMDWCSDADFIERVLLRVKKHEAQFSDSAKLPARETIQRIARAIEHSGYLLGPEDDAEFSLERLQAIWGRLDARLEANDYLVEVVFDSNRVKGLVHEAVEEARRTADDRLRPEFESRWESDLRRTHQSVLDERDRLQSELGESQKAIDAAQSEVRDLADARDALAAELSALKRESRNVLQELRQQIEDSPASEGAVVAHFCSKLEARLDRSLRISPPSSQAPWSSVRGVDSDLVDLSQWADILSTLAADEGLSGLEMMDAQVRAGEVVLLLGEYSEQALSAYANAVAGGSLRRLILDPSFIGLDDLWSSPANGESSALARAWNDAVQEPERPSVVCLTCIDAAPFHLWLPALVAALRSPCRPRNLLVFATALGGGTQSSRSHPNALQLPDLLVPLSPREAGASGFVAFARRARGSIANSVLAWEDTPAQSALLNLDFPVLVSELSTRQVERVAKAFSARAATHGDAGNFLLGWVAAIRGETSGIDDAVLRDGLDAVRVLNFRS